MKKGQITAIVIALVVIVALYLASRTPEEVVIEQATTTEETTEPVNELDAKVEQAVSIIQSGEGSPMQAIGLLREVIAVDSNHIGALYWLGEFSVMSGQFDKAIERFEKLHNLEPGNVEFCIKLARVQVSAGQIENGVATLEAFKRDHPGENVIEQVDAVLEEISVELKN